MASVLQPDIQRSFTYASGDLKGNLQDVRSSGKYYVTHELDREMDRIGNGVNHMKLDTHFIDSSKEWGHRFDKESLNREKAESTGKIAQGTSFMGQYRGNFDVPRVQTLQENQVREMHQWAGDNLGSIKKTSIASIAAEKDLHPYAKSAQGRINQFCDYIGVTDRYTGYRHNLTRGSRDPTKLGMAWLNPAERRSYDSAAYHSEQPSAGQVYLPASLPKRRSGDQSPQISVANLNSSHNNVMRAETAPRARSIQERCGINTTFPGITEYMKRYNRQNAPNKLTHYNINPAPDFSIYGRPSAVVEYSPNNTEYQTRYEWPECKRITKKPWLRK